MSNPDGSQWDEMFEPSDDVLDREDQPVNCVECGEECDEVKEGTPPLCNGCLADYQTVERERELAESREVEPPELT